MSAESFFDIVNALGRLSDSIKSAVNKLPELDATASKILNLIKPPDTKHPRKFIDIKMQSLGSAGGCIRIVLTRDGAGILVDADTFSSKLYEPLPVNPSEYPNIIALLLLLRGSDKVLGKLKELRQQIDNQMLFLEKVINRIKESVSDILALT